VKQSEAWIFIGYIVLIGTVGLAAICYGIRHRDEL